MRNTTSLVWKPQQPIVVVYKYVAGFQNNVVQQLRNLWLTRGNVDEEVAFDVAIKICMAWEVCVQDELLDAVHLTYSACISQHSLDLITFNNYCLCDRLHLFHLIVAKLHNSYCSKTTLNLIRECLKAI